MKKSIMTLLVMIGLSSIVFANDCVRNDTKEIVVCIDGGLMWQDNSKANSTVKDWQRAIEYCEGLNFAGYVDWRLPNCNELESIVDYKKSSGAKIENGFINTSSDYYWSSTTSASNTSRAWYVNFSYGDDNWYDKPNNSYVRCVRAGQ